MSNTIGHLLGSTGSNGPIGPTGVPGKRIIETYLEDLGYDMIHYRQTQEYTKGDRKVFIIWDVSYDHELDSCRLKITISDEVIVDKTYDSNNDNRDEAVLYDLKKGLRKIKIDELLS